MDIIKSIEHEQLKNKIPELKVGNTVKVHVRIKEGNKERIQVFEGIIIKVARRARLFYLRDRVGKAAKTKEMVGARIENREITIKEDLVKEPVEEKTEVVEEPAKEAAPVAEEVKAETTPAEAKKEEEKKAE